MRPVVAIDTNMLLVPFQFGVDIFEEIKRLVPGAKIVILRGTIRELDKIAGQGVKEKKYARLAKRLVEVHKVEIIDRDGPVDSELVRLAKKGVIIATNDRELKRRVWEAGGKVISLREKNRLEMF
ncbi:MAG TPA: DNA-binding protein [Euryarchaeota archaeon]|nr:DNA-binding protein [Euryarchaeota archaeon]